ncbi:YT521-B-like domain [Ranunculus cassubicifolius]
MWCTYMYTHINNVAKKNVVYPIVHSPKQCSKKKICISTNLTMWCTQLCTHKTIKENGVAAVFLYSKTEPASDKECRLSGMISNSNVVSREGDAEPAGTNPNVSAAAPTTSIKSKHANSFRISGSVDAKSSLNSKSFPYLPSSSLSRYSLQILQGTASNKVLQRESEFGAAVSQRASYAARSCSSPSNSHLRLQGSLSGYRPNHHHNTVVGDDVGYNREKPTSRSRSSLFEDLKESSRGPRSCGPPLMLSASDYKDQCFRSSRVERERYNRPDFQAVYENAKFFIIKSYSEEDVHKSIKYDVWSSTPNGNEKLNQAYQEKAPSCPMFLFFSVNGSGQFLGLAEMIGPVDFDKNMDFWQQDKWSGFFPVRWHIIKDVPNTRLRHIVLEYNDNKPVTYTRDTQEVRLKQGLEMLSIFKNYSAGTSMLDDYKFYEDQEKSLQLQKKKKEETPQYDICGSDFPCWNLETEGVPASMSEQFTSLAALAKNLSLNHRR